MARTFPFSDFNSPQHRQWKADRSARQRVPLHLAWRGCLGLAAMWHNVDRDFEVIGERIFYANDNLTWVCLRDIPPGHFPRSFRMNRRDVNWVSTTQATLRHGMPVLDLSQPSRDSVDFRCMPFGRTQIKRNEMVVEERIACGDVLNSDERPRLFSVLNAVSAAMTRYAYFGRKSDGRPAVPVWFKHRRKGETYRIVDPGTVFPTPYLGFRKADAKRLFWAATQRQNMSMVLCQHANR